MATVFLARDLALDRKVAIKVMSPALSETPEAIERFRREARVAAGLSHPRIIPIHAVGEEPGIAYYVMKHVEGRTLDSVLRDEGAQSPSFVRTVLVEIGGALHYAHQRGVVHRDVKPANIMCDTDGWLVVTDFGIAKREDVKGLTQSGMLVGTPYYMAPETFSGQPVTGAADQYALGIVAYEMLTGRTPFGGPSLGEVMKGHLLDPVPPIRSLRPDVPADLEACIDRMLEKDPAKRFPSLSEAAEAAGTITPSLEREMRTQVIELARTGARRQSQMAVPVSPAVPVPRPQPRTRAMARPVVSPSGVRPRRRAINGVIRVVAVVGALALIVRALPERAGQGLGAPAVQVSESPTPAGATPGVPDSSRAVQPAEPAPAAPAPTRTRPSVPQASSSPATQAPAPQASSPPAAVRPRLSDLGLVRLGVSAPRASIQVNDRPPRQFASGRLQNLPLPEGPVRLQIRAPNCLPWDTSFVVRAGTRVDLGMLSLRCR